MNCAANSPCPTCPNAGRYRPIPASGPQPARFLAIGERPGWDENKNGVPFVGKSGQEQNETYFPLAGLRRPDIRVTNVVRCFADNNRTPSEREVRECARHHLPEELRRTNPEVVFLLGGSACRLCPGVRLDMHHGVPQHTSKVGEIFGWSGWVVPMYHPALGLHEGKWMSFLIDDWREVGDIIREDHWETDPEPEPVDYRILRGEEVKDVDFGNVPAVDTESHGPRQYSIQISPSPGRGFMVLAEDKVGIDLAGSLLERKSISLHHAGHDVEAMRRMGIRVVGYRDTMQEAYHLGNLPQGLKPLVYRLFRHTMTSWEDTVRPASVNALLLWLAEALVVARLDLYATKAKTFKTCVCGGTLAAHLKDTYPCRDYTMRTEEEEVRGATEALFNRLIQHTDTDPEATYDPWSRLNAWRQESEADWAHVTARCGDYPILGIGNCTEAQAVAYAVGDADWTGRVAVELERRRREENWRIAPGDEDQ